MLQHAFKEWAVICRALAEGRQALILRQGGLAEMGGDFELKHTRFWLFPTYVHQQRQGIKPEALPLLDQVENERPPAEVLRLTHFADVVGVYHVHEIAPILLLGHHYLWSEQTVRSRFEYRSPGLFVMPVRTYQAAQVHDVQNLPEYAGCRSWVNLELRPSDTRRYACPARAGISPPGAHAGSRPQSDGVGVTRGIQRSFAGRLAHASGTVSLPQWQRGRGAGHDFQVCALRVAQVTPELGAGLIVGMDEDVALLNPCGREAGKA